MSRFAVDRVARGSAAGVATTAAAATVAVTVTDTHTNTDTDIYTDGGTQTHRH